MNWYTLFGYDGNYDVCVHVQAKDYDEAINKVSCFSSGSPDFAVAGKLQCLETGVKQLDDIL